MTFPGRSPNCSSFAESPSAMVSPNSPTAHASTKMWPLTRPSVIGHARPITLGRVNGHIFVEACAVGLFGETIALGDSAKELQFGDLPGKVMNVIAAKRFQYELAGDIKGSGS